MKVDTLKHKVIAVLYSRCVHSVLPVRIIGSLVGVARRGVEEERHLTFGKLCIVRITGERNGIAHNGVNIALHLLRNEIHNPLRCHRAERFACGYNR